MHTKSRKPGLVPSLLTFAALALAGHAATAAGNAPAKAFKGAARIGDATLPPQAMRGTGLSGQFNASALDAATVALAMPDGRTLEARVQRMSVDNAKGRKTWVGTFTDQAGSVLVMTTFRGTTTGFATYGAETWEIVPARTGGHLMYRVDESKFPKTEQMLYPSAVSGDAVSSTATTTTSTTTGSTGSVQDVLVVYTPAAKARWGQATLEGMIQNAVQAANQAYLNSKINITLNLVGLQEISYVESGNLSTSVYDLQGTTDGKMDTVHALRDKLGADVVSLVSEDTSACGIAFTMRTLSASFSSSAFSVVQSSCLSQHSLAHEIGHNQGNQHDRASSTNVGVAAYSYGYRVCDKTDGSGWRDVMSYPCNGAPRVLQFSNPYVYYNGYATGVAYESNPANSADTARSMNETAATVSAFKGTTTSAPAPTAPAATVPAAPTSLAARAASSTSVTLTWVDNATNESGYKVERSGDGVVFTEIASLGAGASSYANSGLTARTNYYYRVRAYGSAGNSAYSNTASVTTPDVAPVAPSSVAAINDADGSATVKWVDASSNETGFEVRRETWDTRKSAWTGATTVASVPAGYSSVIDLSGNGTYRYSVRAVNTGGGSNYAGPVQTTVTGGPTRGKKR
jgi:uncharacterized protein YunC (DUF1805 family)